MNSRNESHCLDWITRSCNRNVRPIQRIFGYLLVIVSLSGRWFQILTNFDANVVGHLRSSDFNEIELKLYIFRDISSSFLAQLNGVYSLTRTSANCQHWPVAKSWSEPMLTYSQLEPWKQISVNLKWKYRLLFKTIHLKMLSAQCRRFCSGLMC